MTPDNCAVIKSNGNCILSIVINQLDPYLSLSRSIGRADAADVVTS